MGQPKKKTSLDSESLASCQVVGFSGSLPMMLELEPRARSSAG